ncbi:MAG: hypothetical protein M1818_003517 [Claussenomyces sp. TS43310]|nr:MAG: hypothetical protein M1818_003517 [Claussenomyces sp. TS43310]
MGLSLPSCSLQRDVHQCHSPIAVKDYTLRGLQDMQSREVVPGICPSQRHRRSLIPDDEAPILRIWETYSHEASSVSPSIKSAIGERSQIKMRPLGSYIPHRLRPPSSVSTFHDPKLACFSPPTTTLTIAHGPPRRVLALFSASMARRGPEVRRHNRDLQNTICRAPSDEADRYLSLVSARLLSTVFDASRLGA